MCHEIGKFENAEIPVPTRESPFILSIVSLMLPYVSLLNILLSVLLVAFNWRTNRNTILLGAIFLIVSIYVLGYHLLVTGESRFWLAVMWGNLAPIYYLAPPCIYLYVRGTLEDRSHFSRKDLFHLIPFVITLIGILPYLFTSFEYKLQVADSINRDLTVARNQQSNWLLSVNANNLIRPILMIAYALASLRLVYRYESRNARSRSIPREQWRIIRIWLLTLTGTLLATNVIALGISYYYSSNVEVDRQMLNNTILRQISGYVIALMPIALLLFPQILYGIPNYVRDGNRQERPAAKPLEHPAHTLSEGNSPLAAYPNYAQGEKAAEDPFKELGDRILQAMEDQKPYTDPDFSLDGLSALLEVPKHHLYYCFRNILQTKFTRLRMDYRIEHAKKLLASADLNMVTLESIGKDSGFASKSGFYNTFKAEVGCSPGEYAERHNRN